ncbi:MAG: O-antigen ligase family protein [Thermoguttaceae bacterium]|nr:O-antigen ligase family protein [Thermoguttaceae bacterium]
MEWIVGVSLAAALLWGLIWCLQGDLLLGALVVAIIGACLGHPFWNMDLGPVPVTLDRIALAGLLVAYGFQWRLGRTDPKPIGAADRWLVALLGMLIVSFLWSDFPPQTLGEGSPLWRLATGYLIPGLVYWVARQASMEHRTVRRVWTLLSCLGLYLAITGILERTQQWQWVWPRHIADPSVGLHFGRARGPMVHAVSFGLYLTVCWLAAAFWAWNQGRFARLLFFTCLPLAVAALFFSYTRSVWLGAALAGLVLMTVGLQGRLRIVILAAMVALALVAGLSNLDRLIAFQREGSAAETAISVQMRGAFAYVSWKMFLDRPLLGFGFGRFPEAKLPYLADRQTHLPLELIRDYVHHNTFLSLLTETGLIGLSLYVGLLGAWGWAAWRLWRTELAAPWAKAQGLLMLAVLAVYLPQALFHEMSYLPSDQTLIFFLAGLTIGLERTVARSLPGPLPKDCSLGLHSVRF